MNEQEIIQECRGLQKHQWHGRRMGGTT